jgi:hypothetical protein
MKWTPWLFGSLAAVMIASCGDRRDNDAGTPGGAGAESGTMQGGATTTDTAVPTTGATDTAGGVSSDTAHGGARMRSDTNKPTPGAGQ